MIPAVSPSHLIGFALVAYALIVIPGPSVLFRSEERRVGTEC